MQALETKAQAGRASARGAVYVLGWPLSPCSPLSDFHEEPVLVLAEVNWVCLPPWSQDIW